MTVKLLTEQHLEFLSLKGGRTGSSDSNHVKMPHGWKAHVTSINGCCYCYWTACRIVSQVETIRTLAFFVFG